MGMVCIMNLVVCESKTGMGFVQRQKSKSWERAQPTHGEVCNRVGDFPLGSRFVLGPVVSLACCRRGRRRSARSARAPGCGNLRVPIGLPVCPWPCRLPGLLPPGTAALRPECARARGRQPATSHWAPGLSLALLSPWLAAAGDGGAPCGVGAALGGGNLRVPIGLPVCPWPCRLPGLLPPGTAALRPECAVRLGAATCEFPLGSRFVLGPVVSLACCRRGRRRSARSGRAPRGRQALPDGGDGAFRRWLGFGCCCARGRTHSDRALSGGAVSGSTRLIQRHRVLSGLDFGPRLLRIDLRELCARKENQRRIIDPEQDQHD